MKTLRLLCSVLALAALSGLPACARNLTVAEKGHTDYVIVRPAAPTAVDDFAVDELAKFLKQSTGADFAVESPDKITAGRKKIFVGLSNPVLKVLGNDPLLGMEDQDHVARNVGGDIFLYGKGLHGNLYAVYEFLENSVGCRWYSVFGGANIPSHETLRLAEFDRRTHLAFPYRCGWTDSLCMRPESAMVLYRNRFNIGMGNRANVKGLVDEAELVPPTVHSLFAYVPPQENAKPGINPPLDFLANKNYFKSNPEFFSMNDNGVRVDSQQLCFSNKELRRTFTANLEENIRRNGGRGIYSVSANDIPGHFCSCPECLKLEKKYGSPNGPLMDYLIEVCGELKEKFPEARVSTLAYRKVQSEIPPLVEKLPDNLIPVFAPIDDNFAADWTDPSNADTYRDLAQWCKLSRNVWVWYYTNPYYTEPVTGFVLPFGNIERLVNDIRLMKQAGVAGMYFEHDQGMPLGGGFYELQTYLMGKLFQNPDADSGALVTEFMGLQYGQAGPSMEVYLDELENLRKTEMGPITWSPSPWSFHYLTPERVARWEGDFDRMEQSVASDPQRLFNVQLVRVCLDVAALMDWQNVHKAFPEVFKDPKLFATRIHAVIEKVGREHTSPALAYYMNAGLKYPYNELDGLMLFAENPGKPLPAVFAGIAADRIKRVVPTNGYDKMAVAGRREDADAAFGRAAQCASDVPFTFGFYDVAGKKFVLNRKLQVSEIKPGAYEIYKLGTAEITPDCYIWMTSSWSMSSHLEKFYEAGTVSKYEIYASLKFEGPSFEKDSKLKEDSVRSDQIILVKAAEHP